MPDPSIAENEKPPAGRPDACTHYLAPRRPMGCKASALPAGGPELIVDSTKGEIG
jgi:hypothetical protein